MRRRALFSRWPWDLALRAEADPAEQSARTPGNVMPIAHEREDQDEACDHEQTRGFQRVDLWRAVMFGWMLRLGWIRLPFWTRRRHGNIVAPAFPRMNRNVPHADRAGSIGSTFHLFPSAISPCEWLRTGFLCRTLSIFWRKLSSSFHRQSRRIGEQLDLDGIYEEFVCAACQNVAKDRANGHNRVR